MNNVITGVAGFLGSNLAESLHARKEEVVGYDNFDRGVVGVKNVMEIQDNLDSCVIGDILDFPKLKTVIKSGVDRVYHMAALPSHRLALERPHDYMSVDLQGTANVLEAARLCDPKPLVIFASSNKVYGKQECPWREDKLPQPEGPYAVAKWAGEMMCEMYSKYFGVPVVVLRYHHVAGRRSNPELALSIFVEQAMKGEALQVHGKRGPSGWESCSANYTHVDDAIRATLLAADYYTEFDIYNIANEKTVTVESMARWVIQRLASKSYIDLVPMLPHETLVHASDVSKAKNRLQFTAQYPAEDAYADYVEWRLKQ